MQTEITTNKYKKHLFLEFILYKLIFALFYNGELTAIQILISKCKAAKFYVK